MHTLVFLFCPALTVLALALAWALSTILDTATPYAPEAPASWDALLDEIADLRWTALGELAKVDGAWHTPCMCRPRACRCRMGAIDLRYRCGMGRGQPS